MCRFSLAVALACAGAAALPVTARSQGVPGAGPYPSRAYRQFLNSPYSYRTYSRISPGYAAEGYTPYGYERFERGPGYLHQEITPYGFSGYQVAPWARRAVVSPVPPVPYPPPPPFGPPAPWAP